MFTHQVQPPPPRQRIRKWTPTRYFIFITNYQCFLFIYTVCHNPLDPEYRGRTPKLAADEYRDAPRLGLCGSSFLTAEGLHRLGYLAQDHRKRPAGTTRSHSWTSFQLVGNEASAWYVPTHHHPESLDFKIG